MIIAEAVDMLRALFRAEERRKETDWGQTQSFATGSWPGTERLWPIFPHSFWNHTNTHTHLRKLQATVNFAFQRVMLDSNWVNSNIAEYRCSGDTCLHYAQISAWLLMIWFGSDKQNEMRIPCIALKINSWPHTDFDMCCSSAQALPTLSCVTTENEETGRRLCCYGDHWRGTSPYGWSFND